MEMLPNVRGRKRADAIACGLVPEWTICGTEHPVPYGKLRREVLIVGHIVVGMMPAMHLGTVDDVLQSSTANVDIGMNVHPPYCIDAAFDNGHFR
jgi:hypothetical protein